MNKNVSSCSTSTCIGQETAYRTSIITVLYTFDGSTNDQSGYATGIAFGSSTPGFASNAYLNRALSLTATSQQYVQISNVDLSGKSFTIQMWFNPGSLTYAYDYGIFGQCDANSICLSLSVRNWRLSLSFDSMNANNSTLSGSTLVVSIGWVHVTIVYDAILFQQRMYVNGLIDAVSPSMVNSYQGISSSSTTTIGRASSFAYGTTYFTG